jgi:hypothetical protein
MEVTLRLRAFSAADLDGVVHSFVYYYMGTYVGFEEAIERDLSVIRSRGALETTTCHNLRVGEGDRPFLHDPNVSTDLSRVTCIGCAVGLYKRNLTPY